MSRYDLERRAPVSRLNREFNLVPGSYWRSTRDIYSNDDIDVAAGLMLMLERIKSVDGEPHTVCLRHHPSESPTLGRRYLIRDFLDAFEPVPDADVEAIRSAEMAAIEKAIEEEQTAIDELSTDTRAVVAALENERREDPDSDLLDGYNPAAGLPDPSHSPATSQSIQDTTQAQLALMRAQADNHAAIVRGRAELVRRHADKLQRLASSIAPFHVERAQALAAHARASLSDLDALYEGLHTLELYTGEQVNVVPVCEGPRASGEHAFDIRQRCLYLDEESLINIEFGGADFSSFDAFKKLLAADEELRDRLLPGPRCIVGMRYRRTKKNYADVLSNMFLNQLNEKSFLLIRNGQRVDAIFSPLDYLPRLFPTKDDLDKPFRGAFGERITLDDVRYADAKDSQDQLALMYKRLLILVWGLYDRTDLIGPFDLEAARGHLNLLSFEVQNAVFRFVPDDTDEHLLASGMAPLHDFLRSRMPLIRSTSRVVGAWREVLRPGNASGCFSFTEYGPDGSPRQTKHPVRQASVEVVARRESELVVKLTVRRELDGRKLKTKVILKRPDDFVPAFNTELLPLDGLISEDIEPRLYSHDARLNYDRMMPMLIAAYRYIRETEEKAGTAIATVRKATKASEILCRRAVMHAIANNGWPDMAEDQFKVSTFKRIVQQSSQIVSVLKLLGINEHLTPNDAGLDTDLPAALSMIGETGECAPERMVRISLGDRAELVVYAVPKTPVSEFWPYPQPWLDKVSFDYSLDADRVRLKKVVSRGASVLRPAVPGEIVLWARDSEASDHELATTTWVKRAGSAPTPGPEALDEQLHEARDDLSKFIDLISGAPRPDAIDVMLREAEAELAADRKRAPSIVNPPSFIVPLGLLSRSRVRDFAIKADQADVFWIIWRADAFTLIHHLGTIQQKTAVERIAEMAYEHSDKKIKALRMPETHTIGALDFEPLTATPLASGVVAGGTVIGDRGGILPGNLASSGSLRAQCAVSLVDENILDTLVEFSCQNDAAEHELRAIFAKSSDSPGQEG